MFGAWDVFYSLDDARGAARSFLRNAADLDLWGVGLHRSLVSAFCEETDPGPPQPWGVPGRGSVDTMTCLRPAPLAEGGTVLGHEILIAAVGCSFSRLGRNEVIPDANLRWNGSPARLVYGGVRKVVSCAEGLERPSDGLGGDVVTIRDGDEATYSTFLIADRASLRRLVHGDPVSLVFEE